MSPTAASMGSARRSKKRKPVATLPDSEETAYDTAATMESGEKSDETVYGTAANVESGKEIMQDPEQEGVAGDEEPVEAGNQKVQNEEPEIGALGYCIVPSEKRFLVLHAFLKRKLSKKIMMECAGIHEKQKQQKRTVTFSNFCNSEKGILLCTNVAACGLDIPDLDYIVQYDPPHKPQDYIHNVEHNARAEKGKGSVILFLLPQELEFLISLKAANICLTEYEFHNKNVRSLQENFEKIVGENYFLHQLAQEAYRSYILAYNSLTMKKAFKVHRLNLKDVAAAFSVKNPPEVNIGPESRDKMKVGGGGKRHRINVTA